MPAMRLPFLARSEKCGWQSVKYDISHFSSMFLLYRPGLWLLQQQKMEGYVCACVLLTQLKNLGFFHIYCWLYIFFANWNSEFKGQDHPHNLGRHKYFFLFIRLISASSVHTLWTGPWIEEIACFFLTESFYQREEENTFFCVWFMEPELSGVSGLKTFPEKFAVRVDFQS